MGTRVPCHGPLRTSSTAHRCHPHLTRTAPGHPRPQKIQNFARSPKALEAEAAAAVFRLYRARMSPETERGLRRLVARARPFSCLLRRTAFTQFTRPKP